MEIKQLTPEYKSEILNMVRLVEDTLSEPAWFLPFTSEILDDIILGRDVIVYGAFSNQNKLMAVSCLFLNGESGCQQLNDMLKLEPAPKTVGLGRCMVLPEFRGQNLMLKINKVLIAIAKQRGHKNIVATVHPDNIASNKSLAALGMKVEAKIIKDGKYPRNICLLKI